MAHVNNFQRNGKSEQLNHSIVASADVEGFCVFPVKEELCVGDGLIQKSKQINFCEPTPKCGEVLVAGPGDFIFVCIVCDNHYKDLESFGIHIREHLTGERAGENDEQLDAGGSDPLSMDTLESKCLPEKTTDSHHVEVHAEISLNLHSDEDSSKDATDSNTIENISRQSAVEKNHICNLCGRSYMHRRSYQVHIKKAHVDGYKPSKPLKLLDDIPALNVPIDETTTCKYCDKQFDDTEALQEHLTTHTGRKRFVCRYCLKTFSCRTTRLQHLSTHTGERHYKCPHCPKTFSGKSNLTSHIRAHLKIKNYSCDYCDKRFVQSSEKKVHELTHTGEKPHQCEECGQRYPTSNKLNEHLRRHKNIKNYKCEICGKAFYGLNLLKNHMPTHTDEKPFSCNICGQTFPRKKSLKTHKQLHSGEKNYVCNKCGKAFAQFAGLYSHMKSHGEKPR